MAKSKDEIYEGMLKEAPTSHSNRPSPAASAFGNIKAGGMPFVMGAPDFLRDTGIVVGTDTDFQAATNDETELLTKIRKGKSIKPGVVVSHTERPKDKYVVLKTNVDIAASGKPRHLVVHSKTGKKYKIASNLLTAE